MNNFVILSSQDSVAVALQDIPAETVLKTPKGEVTVQAEIKRGHKVALQDINEGENVIKYGFPIGHALSNIAKGQWVHTHNLKTNLNDELTYEYKPQEYDNPYTGQKDQRTFMGYKRANGKVGIRNDLYIIPTVGCINPLLDIAVQQFKVLHPDNGSFDNVILLKHPYGCSQLGDDFEQTRKILVDATLQPNAGGVLLFGLGCENNQMSGMKEELEKKNYDPERVRFLVSQEVDDELEVALNLMEELNDVAANDIRTEQPLSKLKIGLKCGGSDGLSGVTANPLLGRISDFVTAQGGSTVLSEVPEMFGAETILMSRADNKATFEKIVKLINDFKGYFKSFDQPIYENPSPGNKEGGITTLEDKSLGCTQKSGHSQVKDVLQYGEKIRKTGLSLLQSPGNDLVSSSAEASADCQMVLFSTGRGTPFATYVPTIKVASNSYIANKKPRWIDFDAGQLMEKPMDELANEFIQFVIDTASGKKTNNEKYGIHGLAIFKIGVTE